MPGKPCQANCDGCGYRMAPVLCCAVLQVFIWSFCNEVGCDNETAAAAFRAIAYFYDTTRGVTQNHLGSGAHPLSERSLDVQGFSHQSGRTFDQFHKNNPTEPMMATECCSCLSQRGSDYDSCPVQHHCTRPSVPYTAAAERPRALLCPAALAS